MKRELAEILICPACLPLEHSLICSAEMSDGNDVLEGQLICKGCARAYPIREGIANLIPAANTTMAQLRYEEDFMVSSYLWAHYADMIGDPDALDTYDHWAKKLEAPTGRCLDAGCAVGRITLEMSATADFAVGIDRSEPFIRWARRILHNETTTFSMKTEGSLTELKTIIAADHWRPERAEFILADALVMPFPSSIFATATSINILDKIANPLGHIIEMNRVARREEAHLFISDPFSWSEKYAPSLQWLGGKESGRFSGSGLRNINMLLIGKNQVIQPSWNVREQGYAWWKIRNHINHFELIRSQYISAVR